MEAFVPVLLDGELRQCMRHRKKPYFLPHCAQLAIAQGNRRDQLGLGGDPGHAQEAGHSQNNLPVDAFTRKFLVDDGMAGTRRHDEYMALARKCLPGQAATSEAWMRLRHQADIILPEKHLLIEARFQLRHEPDRQIHVVILQTPHDVGGYLFRLSLHVGRHITYIATDEGWLFLAVVIDLFNRQVVGWSLRDDMTSSIVVDALRMAWFRRHPSRQTGLIFFFHSDRGSQYASRDFRDVLQEYGLTASMSRRANCWDNACSETLFG